MAFQPRRPFTPRKPGTHAPRRTGGGSSSRFAASASAPSSRNKNVKQWPQHNEIVVVRVDKILDYGVFCSLLEYAGASGFVHISQVESSWIKNIRNHVKEGQMRAALVQKVDLEKYQIDLSLTKVSERQQRLRIEEYKQLVRNKKLVENMAKTMNRTLEEGWKAIAEPLIADYGTLPQAFEAIAMDGAPAAEAVEAEWIPTLVDVVQKNVKPAEKEVKGVLTIACMAPDGIEKIKHAIIESPKTVSSATVQFSYLGAGKYLLKVVSFDYKFAEKALSTVQERLHASLGKDSEVNFARQEA